MTEPDEPTRAVPAAAVIAGRYRLDLLVGRGGTAEVWRSTDTSLDRVVALKLVTAPHDESAVRAADEAKTLAQLSHPSLVQVYDAGTDNAGRPWVVMEYVEGQTLSEAIRTRPLPVQRVAAIGAGLADALGHVHARGMVHRDVKPGNVLLGGDGTVKLTDFGIARLVDAAKVTSTGLMVGTASYLAPEQVAGEQVGPPSDVYALGLLLLEALTGTREYDGPPMEAAMARLHRSPVMPPSLEEGWSGVLSAMTARDPQSRPSAVECGDALRSLMAGEIIALVAPVTTALRTDDPRTTLLSRTSAVPAVGPAARPSRTPWVVTGVLAVVAAVAAGVAISKADTATPRPVPAVRTDLPNQLERELQDFSDQVARS
ncbi:MAG TPA: serine/threonine-protein kinase [Mycobacteriales bacterium]|nr:serine/threonine-protein kinase [Mycobacteriales bacterium]